MCNLYSITTNQEAIRQLFRVINRYVGNLPSMPSVFPDYPAPVVRNAGAERELVLMRWGMPPPPRTGGPPVTNIRNTSSPHWRGWLKPENRCLVPFNSFAEYAPEPNVAAMISPISPISVLGGWERLATCLCALRRRPRAPTWLTVVGVLNARLADASANNVAAREATRVPTAALTSRVLYDRATLSKTGNSGKVASELRLSGELRSRTGR